MVAAFEQSLTNMTQRLQQLSATADRKDSELTEMRQTIELLRKQSIQAGLTSAHMHSMNEQPIRPVEQNATQQPPPVSSSATETTAPSTGTLAMQRHLSSDSMCSLNSVSSGCSAQDKKKKKGWVSFTEQFKSRLAMMMLMDPYVFFFRYFSCEVPLPKHFHGTPKYPKQIAITVRQVIWIICRRSIRLD